MNHNNYNYIFVYNIKRQMYTPLQKHQNYY